MQSIDTSGLELFDRDLARILEGMPEERRRLHEEIGEMIKQDLDAAVSSSGLNDTGGNVRRWQVKHIGTRGGYAAVRPAGGKEGAQTGRNGPGAITNYLTNGHAIRPARGGKDYRPRIRVARVRAYGFYDSAKSSTEAKAIRKVHEYVDRLAARVEGTG